MSIYKIPIIAAFIFFPIISLIFTLPYLIYQYRKYGSIPILRSLIFYSFILYLLCAYFLIILPLPSITEVAKLTTPTTQLTPFHFIKELSQMISIDWNKLSTYYNLLKNQSFYIVLFNILLTIPFGVYLHYYFECKWYKVLIYSFLLSLFFELTQLTGLYGIYPRAYRLFDVDDLILNTTGAMIGYSITPIFLWVLPSRKQLDQKSFEKGVRVTLFRRAISYCIDFFFLSILILIISIFTYKTKLSNYTLLISIIIYYLIIPLIIDGKTLGKIIVKLKIVAKKEKKHVKIRIWLRYLLSYLLFYYQFVIINILNSISSNNKIIDNIIDRSIDLLKVYFFLNIICLIIGKKKEFLYEKITSTKNISTIEYETKNTKDNKEKENVRIKKDKKKL